MSFFCPVDACEKLVEFECKCQGKSRFCKFHYGSHFQNSACIAPENVKDKAIAGYADVLLKELNEKQRELCALGQQMQRQLHEYVEQLLVGIRDRKARVQLWMKGNETDIAGINIGLENGLAARRLEEFTNAMRRLQQLGNVEPIRANPGNTNVIRMPEPIPSKYSVSCNEYLVNSKPLLERKILCKSLKLNNHSPDFFDQDKNYVQEILFTDDGKYVFVCKSYADCMP